MPKGNLFSRIIGVVGELLITSGVIVLLFVTWQLFVNDPQVSSVQQKQAQEFVQPDVPSLAKFEDVGSKLPQGKVFGKIYIPRFSNNYERLIGQGTFQKITLNPIGVGHYLSSQWPGEEGNFAVAAHRTSHGAPFFKIDTLGKGDQVFIETNDGWFTYNYLYTEIVAPTDIGVINKVPKGLPGAHAGGHYMTMTSCHPKWSNSQRIVVWLELSAKTTEMPSQLADWRSHE